MSTQIAITTQDVPPSFCHHTWPETWAFLVGLLNASFAEDLNTINFGNTTPSTDNRDKPWMRTNADGSPDGWYTFSNGYWLKRCTLPAPGAIMMWDGLEADIVTLDGGEAGAITETTGAFWEKVSAMDGRFPLGVGTVGSTSVAVGATGGAHQVTLELDEIPEHDHGMTTKKMVHHTSPSGTLHVDSGNDMSMSTFQADGGSSGVTQPHNNMPPYRGMFYVKRTARLYHRAP